MLAKSWVVSIQWTGILELITIISHFSKQYICNFQCCWKEPETTMPYTMWINKHCQTCSLEFAIHLVCTHAILEPIISTMLVQNISVCSGCHNKCWKNALPPDDMCKIMNVRIVKPLVIKFSIIIMINNYYFLITYFS